MRGLARVGIASVTRRGARIVIVCVMGRWSGVVIVGVVRRRVRIIIQVDRRRWGVVRVGRSVRVAEVAVFSAEG